MQGFAQQMLHLANPVFDGMTFVKGRQGGRDAVFGHSKKLRKSLPMGLREGDIW